MSSRVFAVTLVGGARGRECLDHVPGHSGGAAVPAVPVTVLLVVDSVAPAIPDVVCVAFGHALQRVDIRVPQCRPGARDRVGGLVARPREDWLVVWLSTRHVACGTHASFRAVKVDGTRTIPELGAVQVVKTALRGILVPNAVQFAP